MYNINGCNVTWSGTKENPQMQENLISSEEMVKHGYERKAIYSRRILHFVLFRVCRGYALLLFSLLLFLPFKHFVVKM